MCRHSWYGVEHGTSERSGFEHGRLILPCDMGMILMQSTADERLRQLEERIDVYRRRVDGWPCNHCEGGWISGDGDVLRCNACAYFRYL